MKKLPSCIKIWPITKGIIYYTDNHLEEPIFSIVQHQILQANLPVISVSQKPIDFGKNVVLNLKSSYLSMITQITTALNESDSEVVFFCEHDVLYPPSHFDFTPAEKNIFYYNDHIWRWKYPENLAIAYDRLICLSGLCVNREFALDHYQKRLKKIYDLHLENDRRHEPDWARKWGYEPGTKKKRRGGFSDDDFATWHSYQPLVDIRHAKTFSPPKISLQSFKHQPTGWKETTLDKIPYWDLKSLFTKAYVSS